MKRLMWSEGNNMETELVEEGEQNNAAEEIIQSQHFNLEASVLGFFHACYERHLNVHPALLSISRSVKMGKLPELVSKEYQCTASYLRFQSNFLWTRSMVMRKCLPNGFKARLYSSSLALCLLEGTSIMTRKEDRFLLLLHRLQLVVVLDFTLSSSSICRFFRSQRVSRRWI